MRRVGLLLAGVVVLFLSAPVQALNPGVIDPTIEHDANKKVLISSVFTKRGEVFAELHNNTEDPINITGWALRFSTITSEADVLLPSGWLLADDFVSFSENSLVGGVFGFSSLGLPVNEAITSIKVLDNEGTNVSGVAVFPADIILKWYQRKSSGITGTFTSDFSAATSSTRLRHTPLYILPTDTPTLRIVEIYPHSSDCAPTDMSILCGDYVKLYNPSDQIATLGDYRLRTDSSTSESSNAFHLDKYQDISPGGYLIVSLRDDGDEMSLTDDSGWVWLEDAEGILRYEETVISYPSASSSTKIGQAWALTENGAWQWTPTPSPDGPNVFPILEPGVGARVLGDSTTCPQGKYRNPETNRCRNIEDAIATLAACAEGQERNQATNRCRSTASISAVVLTPCEPGQVRNPATNRCRNTVASSSLTPCPKGQERNPETNRCRKTALATALSPAVIGPIKQQTSNPFVMTLLGAVGVGAIGYGIYEWRSELAGALRKATPRLGKK